MKTQSILILTTIAACTLPASAEPDLSKLPPSAKKPGITYAKDIRPIFEAGCFRCHGEEKHKGDFRLDSLEAVLQGREDGKVVTVGDSAKSPLVIAVAQLDDKTAMPPKRKPGGPGGPGGFGGPGGGGPGFGGPGGPPPAAPGDATKSPAAPAGKSAPSAPSTQPQGGPGGQPQGGPGGRPGPGFAGPGGPGGPGGGPPKPLTAEQVGLIRAWIDQGVK